MSGLTQRRADGFNQNSCLCRSAIESSGIFEDVFGHRGRNIDCPLPAGGLPSNRAWDGRYGRCIFPADCGLGHHFFLALTARQNHVILGHGHAASVWLAWQICNGLPPTARNLGRGSFL